MYWKNTKLNLALRALASRVLKLNEGAKTVFMKDRPVPHSLVEKVEKEYDRLIKSDILLNRSIQDLSDYGASKNRRIHFQSGFFDTFDAP